MESNGFKALVVDDELPIRVLMVRALQDLGFECEQAQDGAEAWEHLQKQRFHLVVTDLRMPRQHGHSLCVRMLKAEKRPYMAVLTGVREPKLARDLENRGVDSVRFKPLNFRNYALELLAGVEQRHGKRLDQDEQTPDREPEAPIEQGQGTNVPNASSMTAMANIQAKHEICLLLRDISGAEKLAEALANTSTRCVATRSSEHLCAVLDQQRVDLLIVENNLGGFLTGAEIIARLNQQLIRPRVILMDEPSDDIDRTADELGIDVVCSPQRDHADLARDVSRILSDNSERDAFIPPLARHLVKDFGDMPPLPQLVVKLAGYLSMPLNDIPIDELARDISADTKATTDLLKLTNNSRSLFQQVNNVHQAVNLHGPKRTITLVLSAAAMSVQSKTLNEWNESHRQWYQKRSVVIASTASTVAAKFENASPDTAFILGLVQDIGCLVLSKKFGTKYDHIVRRVRDVGRSNLHVLEMEAFNVHHGHVSAALLQRWRLPQSLIRPVVLHHDVNANEHLSKADATLLRVMQIGEAMANGMEVPHPFRSYQLNQLLSHYTDRTIAEREEMLSEAIVKSHELCEVFDVPVPDASELEMILRNSREAISG